MGSLRGHVSLPEGILVPAEFSEHPADVVTHIPLHVEHERGHATRMKAKRPHRVPLARRAVEILDATRTLGDGTSPLVFPTVDGTPIPEQALRRLLQDQQIAAVPHGFRSTFRDWAAEDTDHPREVIEAALAHTVHNQVEAAYARSDLFERRRRLMDDWAEYVGG